MLVLRIPTEPLKYHIDPHLVNQSAVVIDILPIYNTNAVALLIYIGTNGVVKDRYAVSMVHVWERLVTRSSLFKRIYFIS